MNKKNSKKQEFDNFNQLSKEWWNPKGKFKILHNILPVRIEYILEKIPNKVIKNLNILDLGCGGGLTCEPLSRLGAKVTGIDFIEENINIAKQHAIQSNLSINYIKQDLEKMELNQKFDMILLLEVLEHIDDWHLIIKKIKKNLKPKGKIIISTINKTKFSKIFGIYFAENILNWVPKNTHNYNKLIEPKKLITELTKNEFIVKDLTGMNYNLLSREWILNKNIYPIN